MTNPKIELRDYLKILIRRLLYIKGINKQLKLIKEWETPNRIVALEIGSYFYKLVAFSFNRTLLIELCLLLDGREEKSIIDWLNKALENSKSIEPKIYNHEKEQREMLNIDLYCEIIEKQQELINSKKTIIDNIKGRRDTTLAHSDAKYFNNPEDTYAKFPLSNDDIEDVIEVATEILQMQYLYLFGYDLDIQVHATSNVDAVFWHSRAFERVWFDKRAKSLYPYFYKIDDYEENEDGEGVATDWKQVFGDYRVPKYRRFRNRYKNGDVPAIPTDWYSFEGKGKANPPVYQALWGTKGTDWFGSKSLLELCTEFEEQELEELPFKPERESPLKVGGNGTAEFLMNNVPGFRKFVLDTVNDTDQYQLPNGKYRPKRAMNMQRKNPTPYPLTDAQSDAFMEFLDAKYNYDLSGLFLDVNWRQMEHAAKMLPEYKAKGYGKKVEKSSVSKDRVKKSQEKSPVSLSWKEIMKVRT
jgi:hypothetical protein